MIADEQASLAAKHRVSQAGACDGVSSSPEEAPLTEPSPRPPVSPSAAGAAPIVSTGAAIAWHTPQQPSPARPGSSGPVTAEAPHSVAKASSSTMPPVPPSEASTVPEVAVGADPSPSENWVDQHAAGGGVTTTAAGGAEVPSSEQQAAAAEGTPATPRRVPAHGGTPASVTGTRPSQLRHSRLLHMTPQANAMAAGSYASPGRSRSRPPGHGASSPSDAARRSSGSPSGAGLAAWRAGARHSICSRGHKTHASIYGRIAGVTCLALSFVGHSACTLGAFV